MQSIKHALCGWNLADPTLYQEVPFEMLNMHETPVALGGLQS